MLAVVIAVITKAEKVLLIQRAPGIRGGGYWAPTSGEVEGDREFYRKILPSLAP
jgi:8-oxo-dGTP pyrophosphatase MutT (NUDIX family)